MMKKIFNWLFTFQRTKIALVVETAAIEGDASQNTYVVVYCNDNNLWQFLAFNRYISKSKYIDQRACFVYNKLNGNTKDRLSTVNTFIST